MVKKIHSCFLPAVLCIFSMVAGEDGGEHIDVKAIISEKLSKSLARKITFKFDEIPFTEAINSLCEMVEVKIIILPGSIKQPEPLISLHANDTEAEVAMIKVVELAECAMDIRGDCILISAPKNFVPNKLLRLELAADAKAVSIGKFKDGLARRVAFDFDEIPFSKAIDSLEELTKVQMFILPHAIREPEPKISFRANDIETEQALIEIVKMAEYAMARQDDLILIGNSKDFVSNTD